MVEDVDIEIGIMPQVFLEGLDIVWVTLPGGGVGGYPYQGDPYYGAPPEPDLEPEKEVEILKSHSEALKKQLDEIQARMDELSKEQKAK
ncbi:unnamed protein product [marine sediment metagenome]|uniref:Uncharacterized protein n=1 Tax=marine sediment metagenome TaxID=412755 RepID=X1AW25_9ZZZZ